jgi:hypothetical protein
LVIALILATVLVVMAVLSLPRTVEPYDPEDSSSTGLRALVLWLEELGYPVTIGVPSTGLLSDRGLLFIHPTSFGEPEYISDADVTATYEWVRNGGTLVLVGPTDRRTSLAQRFGVDQVKNLRDFISTVHQVQPLLPDLPGVWESFFATRSLTFLEERAVVPLLAQNSGDPVVAVQFIGDGVVWHLTEEFALTNLNLRDERIASLLPAMLRTVPDAAPVIFSTHHLAQGTDAEASTINTLQDWLYSTPFGRGLLVIMVATFIFLLLQGRRLGPPLPAQTASRPREAAEYVTALAGLQRRIRQPQLVADHHRQRLKSTIGRLALVPADLPDGEWLAQLQRAEFLSPALLAEVTELLGGFAEINRTAIRNGNNRAKAQNRDTLEGDLILLVQATDALLATLPRAQLHRVR